MGRMPASKIGAELKYNCLRPTLYALLTNIHTWGGLFLPYHPLVSALESDRKLVFRHRGTVETA